MPAKKKTSAPVAKAKPEAESGELGLIRKLAAILNETGLTEIELDHKGARVRVSRTVHATTMVSTPAIAAAPAPVGQTTPLASVSTAAAPIAGTPLKSPMVGTAYLAAAPGTPDFTSVGAMVKEGQTLLIIEAMKTMNQILAPKSGKVVQINIENAVPVEFGEVLMVIE
jgi:acetyl-CoA carboxylase biotin carboxyl carrier protein